MTQVALQDTYRERADLALREAGILPPEALQELERLMPALADTWRKRQLWRTETEMRLSVLNDIKHPTPASKYWQAVREQAVFADQLVHLCYDYLAKQAELDALTAEADITDHLAEQTQEADHQRLYRAQARMKRVEAARAEYLLADMRLAALDRLREVRLWEKLKAEQVAAARAAGEPFDTTDPNTHQRASYLEQWRREAAVMANGNEAVRNLLAKLTTAERLTAGVEAVAAATPPV